MGVLLGGWGLVGVVGTLTHYGGTAIGSGNFINLGGSVAECAYGLCLLLLALPIVSIFQIAAGTSLFANIGSGQRTIATWILLSGLVQAGLFSASVIHSLYWCWPHHDISFCSWNNPNKKRYPWCMFPQQC